MERLSDKAGVSTSNELRARNLRTLAALAGLFLLPLLFAFWMYYATDWRPGAHVNHGVLISPVRPLPHVQLPRVGLEGGVGASAGTVAAEQKWSLVYLGMGSCDESCRQALYVMRQVRLYLNTDMTRVVRVFLSTGECCAREFLAHEHPGLVVLDASGPDAAPLLREFPADGREHSLFIVDPLGNLMMSYDVRQDQRGLIQDLQKLLRLSHIG